LSSRYQNSPWVNNYDSPPSRRTTRQGNRRPRPPTPNREDPFGNLDPQTNNQGQWSNVGNQRPNQPQNFNNRPSNQNQWSTNGNNPGQNQWGTNGNNPGQNQWGTNGNNPGQNQWGTNGNNPGQNQWNNQGPNRPPTNNQNVVQTSTTAPNSEEVNEAQRNTCNTNCREKITNEYNPVCGSDSQTYQNRRFLDCVANCGIRKYCSFVCNLVNKLT
jgi:hypothetical protein